MCIVGRGERTLKKEMLVGRKLGAEKLLWEVLI